MSFEIEVGPRNSAHGQCVDISASVRLRDIVVMVLMPNCAAGLDINVIRPKIILREDHSSQKEQVPVVDDMIHECRLSNSNDRLFIVSVKRKVSIRNRL